MSEYIKREDVKYALNGACVLYDPETINKIPSADVVEVVRCKDCKYYVPISEKIGECKDTRMNSTYMSYCSYGERKDNE